LFEIDPDIRKARTVDADFYTDPRYFINSKEKIFARSWHFMGRPEEIDQLKPAVLLPGLLDEPVLLIKAGNDVSCMSNVCTHRAKILIEDPCRADLIRCRYHGRRFDLTGKMISMPEFGEVEDFPSETDNLASLSCGERGGFVFAAIEPARGLDEYFDDTTLMSKGLDAKGLKFLGAKDYTVNAHWALYCENYLEGFHIPYVHRGLNEIVDYGTYRTDLYRYSSLQTGFAADGSVAARYLFVFPNMMFNIYPWGISVNVVRPVALDSTIVEFLT
jgi:choline monooxygenase